MSSVDYDENLRPDMLLTFPNRKNNKYYAPNGIQPGTLTQMPAVYEKVPSSFDPQYAIKVAESQLALSKKQFDASVFASKSLSWLGLDNFKNKSVEQLEIQKNNMVLKIDKASFLFDKFFSEELFGNLEAVYMDKKTNVFKIFDRDSKMYVNVKRYYNCVGAVLNNIVGTPPSKIPDYQFIVGSGISLDLKKFVSEKQKLRQALLDENDYSGYYINENGTVNSNESKSTVCYQVIWPVNYTIIYKHNLILE